MIELIRKLCYAVPLEIEVVHVDIEALAVFYREILFGVLQEECGLSDATCAFDANESAVPINLIHQGATYGGINMFNQIAMCAIESFHSLELLFCCCKGTIISLNCKL
jgi:hypothetical protein